MSNETILKVEDMTCSHCVAAITRAIQKAHPSAAVTADTVSKLVVVRGVADFADLSARIAKAGFTPQPI
jgi:copper chaperone